MRHPQISVQFCEKGRKSCSNDYMKAYPTLSFVKKGKLRNKQTNIFGVCNNPFWADEGLEVLGF